MRRRLLEVALAAALGSLAGSALVGAHGTDAGKIHGCYPADADGGTLLLLNEGTTECPAGHTAVDWAKTGPQGPQGPAGTDPGPPGPVGPQGPAGTGFGFRTVPSGTVRDDAADCASDEIAIGGGHSIGEHHLGFSVEWSRPFNGRSWGSGIRIDTLKTYVVCAKRRSDLALPVVPRP